MSDAVAFMSRHFVALTCDYETIKKDGSVDRRGTLVYSGFLLELHGITFWVTAGHCLKDELDAGLNSGQLRILSSGFMDSFGHEATHMHSIPFTYEVGCSYYVEQPEHGIDYALIMLNSLTVKAFEANKLMAITRENWVYQPELTFDFYRILGIPIDRVFTTILPDGTIDTKVGQAMVAVNKISLEDVGRPPPDYEGTPSESWFIGRVDPECNIKSLKGMSGGPVYGFRRNKNGDLVYHVVALQSRWWRDSRTVFGCSMTLFAEEVYHQLGDLLSSLNGGDDSRVTGIKK